MRLKYEARIVRNQSFFDGLVYTHRVEVGCWIQPASPYRAMRRRFVVREQHHCRSLAEARALLASRGVVRRVAALNRREGAAR